MYICICNAITEKDIEEAVKQGISSMAMLSEVTSVSNQCGCCEDHACRVLQKALSIASDIGCSVT